MPITNLASYLPTMDEFAAHWETADAEVQARGEDEIRIRDGTTLRHFRAVRAELVRLLAAEEAARQRRLQREEERRLALEAVRPRLERTLGELRRLDGGPEAEWARAFPSLDRVESGY